MLYASDLIRWLQRKRYQYEVTFSLYMLTPTEKFIFSTVPALPITQSYILKPPLPAKKKLELPNCRLQHGSLALLYSLVPTTFHLPSKHTQHTLTSFLHLRHLPPPLHLHDHRRRLALPPRTRDENGQQSLVLLCRGRDRRGGGRRGNKSWFRRWRRSYETGW